MHEFSTMTQIVEIIGEELKKNNADKVVKVYLKIGELTFLGMEQLRFAFEVLSEGTPMEKAELDIHLVKPTVRCSCGYQGGVESEKRPEFHISVPLLHCPVCGKEVEIIGGQECVLSKIQMETKE